MAMYQLSADELLLVYLTLLARDEENQGIFFEKWHDNGGQEKLRDLFNSLKEKGIIHKNYNPEAYIPNDIEFNKVFLKSWMKASGELGRELFDEYPPFLNINGKYAPLRDISKKFSSLEEFYFFYSSQIGHNPEKHKEVMEIMRWAKNNGHLNFGLTNFVISHQWDALKQLRDDPSVISTASNVCLDE